MIFKMAFAPPLDLLRKKRHGKFDDNCCKVPKSKGKQSSILIPDLIKSLFERLISALAGAKNRKLIRDMYRSLKSFLYFSEL